MPAVPAAEVRRVLRWSLLGVLLLAVAVAVWTLVVLLGVRSDLTHARAALADARSTGDLGRAAPELATAEADLERASRRLGSPAPALAAEVPVLGRPVRAVQRTSVAALAVVRSTRLVLAAAQPQRPLVTAGGLDLGGLRHLGDVLDQAASDVRGPVTALAEQETGLVPGVVRRPVQDAQRQLAPLPDSFARTAAAVRGLAAVTGGDRPHSLLVVLENNAELRGSGGVVTVFAQAKAANGRVRVGRFRDVEDVSDAARTAQRVAAPGDYTGLWGRFLANSTLWKNVNMTPDLPTASLVLSRIAERSLGERPDAVVWLDVRTIADVLGATGPAVLADGSRLTADNAVTRLLSTAYATVPDTAEGQRRRRAALRGAADAVLQRLLGRGSAPSPAALGLALAGAARGRHLALWSATPGEQADLLRAGLAGAVAAPPGGDLASFVVQNLGGGDRDGNKLDYYARREMAVTARVGRTGALVEQRVTLHNNAPARGLPAYVAGRGTPGTSNSLVTFAVPSGAQLQEFSREGRAIGAVPQPEGDHQVLQDVVSLPPGTSGSWRLRYRLPLRDGAYALRVVPQPLATDADLQLQVRPERGLVLDGPDPGTGAPSAPPRQHGPLAEGQLVRVVAHRPGVLRRVAGAISRFWTEPVQL